MILPSVPALHVLSCLERTVTMQFGVLKQGHRLPRELLWIVHDADAICCRCLHSLKSQRSPYNRQAYCHSFQDLILHPSGNAKGSNRNFGLSQIWTDIRNLTSNDDLLSTL